MGEVKQKKRKKKKREKRARREKGRRKKYHGGKGEKRRGGGGKEGKRWSGEPPAEPAAALEAARSPRAGALSAQPRPGRPSAAAGGSGGGPALRASCVSVGPAALPVVPLPWRDSGGGSLGSVSRGRGTDYVLTRHSAAPNVMWQGRPGVPGG